MYARYALFFTPFFVEIFKMNGKKRHRWVYIIYIRLPVYSAIWSNRCLIHWRFLRWSIRVKIAINVVFMFFCVPPRFWRVLLCLFGQFRKVKGTFHLTQKIRSRPLSPVIGAIGNGRTFGRNGREEGIALVWVPWRRYRTRLKLLLVKYFSRLF